MYGKDSSSLPGTTSFSTTLALALVETKFIQYVIASPDKYVYGKPVLNTSTKSPSSSLIV